ncbi:MAG: hypothetical protein HQL07_04635 [Nitrospirae bacterium]|nr:hypothetical protein [Magnetococcales bacterium]HAT50776.1 hypothetical protein [Alphaproteobacteria bacterium]
MSVSFEPSKPGIENRVFQGIYTITRDGKEVAYCAFTDEAFKHLVLAAPDLFAACDAVMKAVYEFDLHEDARKHDLETCLDPAALARIMADTPSTGALAIALEQVMEACVKARGESQEDYDNPRLAH